MPAQRRSSSFRAQVPARRSAGIALATLLPAAAATLLAGKLFGPGVAQPVALCAAFQVALADFARLGGRSEDGLRMVAGLVCGACCSHLGWIGMHATDVQSLARVLFTGSGLSVLFVPIGVWLCAPRAAGRRRDYLACALGSLPLALATARLGCVAAGCCGGTNHPTQLYETAACAGLSIVAKRVPADFAGPASVGGLGLIRLIVEPLRAPSPSGPPTVPVAAIAGVLLLAGTLLAARQRGSAQ